jgi:hypothetical protein
MSDKKISELTGATTINPNDVSVLVNDGTDYKFAFSTLLQFLGNNLSVGANISFGTTLPQNTSGKNGDVFINIGTGSFAKKTTGFWSIAYTIPSASALTDGTILYGLGLPGSSIGNNNDTYINTNTGIFYKKASGIWGQVFSMQTGPQGPQGVAGANGTNGTNGFSVLNGTTNPSNLSTGVNGDFYINTTNYTLFGPKNGDIWGDGVSLVGSGIKPGGTAGQILSKNSNSDYDTNWIDPVISGGGGGKATADEINTGTDDEKFATALGLEDSKYITQSGSKISATASGTDAYTADIDPAVTAYNITQHFYIRFTNANTSPDCTLSLNGLSALPLVKGIETYLSPDDIVADSIHLVALDGVNARILSLSSIPTVTTGEKVLTITSAGPQKTYDLQELTVSSSSLTTADFSTGIAVVTGLVGQLSYDTNYRYDCIGINQWRRSALNGNLIDLYLADVDDTGGDKTSSDLETAYPSSLIGQQAWGVNNLYIKKTTTGWKKVAIATA